MACDLVQAFDVIVPPSSKTKEMSLKSDRKIRTKTVYSMLGPARFRFRRKSAWMCPKFGKRLVIENEACTSRTRAWDGFVDQHVGGANAVTDGTVFVDRDMNGARGIMLRALNGKLCRLPRFLSADRVMTVGYRRSMMVRRIAALFPFARYTGSHGTMNGIFNLAVPTCSGAGELCRRAASEVRPISTGVPFGTSFILGRSETTRAGIRTRTLAPREARCGQESA